MSNRTQPISKLADTMKVFPVWDGTSTSHARVRLYERVAGGTPRFVVVVSQVPTVGDTSITNTFEEIATWVTQAYHLPTGHRRVGWLEHYPPHSVGNHAPRVCEVSLAWNRERKGAEDPRWRVILPKEVQRLLGEVIEHTGTHPAKVASDRVKQRR